MSEYQELAPIFLSLCGTSSSVSEGEEGVYTHVFTQPDIFQNCEIVTLEGLNFGPTGWTFTVSGHMKHRLARLAVREARARRERQRRRRKKRAIFRRKKRGLA